MEQVNNKKKALLISIVIVLAAFFAYKIVSVLLESLEMNYYVFSLIKQAWFFALTLLAAFLMHKLNVLRWKKDGWKNGLLVGIYFIIMSVFACTMGIVLMILAGKEPTIRAWEFILFLIQMLLVGLSEELLFRGLMQNSFHDFFGEDSVSAVKKAILFSGLLFGFIHIFNIFSGASVIGTIIQVIQVVPLGMLFGAIYFRSGKNLWVTIILHAVYDGCALIQTGVLYGVTAAQSISSYNVSGLVLTVVVILIVLFVTRKKKIQQCIDAKQLS